MRQLICLFFLSFVIFLPANAAPVVRFVQEATVTYTQLGAVRIRAIERLNTPMRLEFYSLKTKKILANIQPSDDPMVSPISECIRFKIINDKRFAAPLIYLVTVSMGGSDGTFWGQLIGWRDNKFQVLNDAKFETAVQGGFFVGDLGKEYGFGVASWEFIWCVESKQEEPNCNESHYRDHRYKITLYPLNVKTLKFKKVIVLETKKKYGGHGETALKEFGLNFTDLRKDNSRLREMADYQ